MELYSKEFWRACLTLPTAALSNTVAQALFDQSKFILKWLDGEPLEELKPSNGWRPVGEERHRFMHHHQYRVTPPKPIERDVVVFYRDALPYTQFKTSAGIDVRLLWPEGTNEKAKTLAQLEADMPGFKLLSITRVVVDPTNHNLLGYTTELDNLGRVPF